jgi:hypothetical protein
MLSCTSGSQPASKPVDSVAVVVDSLRSRIDSLESDNFDNKWEKLTDKIALLKPASDGYATIKSEYGVVTVSIENVSAYANGSRVTLRFGNTTSAGLTGVSYTIDWGRVDRKGAPLNDEALSKKLTIKKTLIAGSWNSVQVVLEQTPPTELGWVRIKDFQNNGISLTTVP